MSFKSASGYASLEATPLARIGYYDQIIERVWEQDFIPEIVNSSIDERITRCNQVVQFLRQPKVGKWRRYEKNQELIPNQVTPESFCMEICNAAYQDIKVDEMDIAQACSQWDSWESSFLDSAYQSLVELWRDFVLNGMILEASVMNKGAKAGKFHNINLGTPGQPLVVTPDNVQQALARMKLVLKQAQRWVEGEMFIVLPDSIIETLAISPYAKADWMGPCVDCSMSIDGLLPQKLWGFNVILSSNVPQVMDSSGVLAYYVVAGNRDAFAFAGDIIRGRLVEPTRTFSVEYQMLCVWGGKAIYPDALAVGYWTFGE